MPEWYVPMEPRLPPDIQLSIAQRDLVNLRTACEHITKTFRETTYELVILDDFTVFVWLKNQGFRISLYPSQGVHGKMFTLFIESPITADELPCGSTSELMRRLNSLHGT